MGNFQKKALTEFVPNLLNSLISRFSHSHLFHSCFAVSNFFIQHLLSPPISLSFSLSLTHTHTLYHIPKRAHAHTLKDAPSLTFLQSLKHNSRQKVTPISQLQRLSSKASLSSDFWKITAMPRINHRFFSSKIKTSFAWFLTNKVIILLSY